jgi:hypothetical protein
VAITTAQILIRTDRLERLLKSVEAYLARWARSAKADWPDVPFLGRETSRNTFVLPPVDGWCCLLDPDRYRADAELASHLAKALDATTIVLELRGGALTWSCVAYEGRGAVRQDREPEEAFGPEPPHGDGPMPIYPDPTLEAIRALRVEGVPQAYWLLAQDDLEESPKPDGQGSVWVDEIVARPEKKRAIERRLRVPFGLRREPGRIPFPPDMDTTGSDHRRLFVEIRSLWGRPDHQAIDNLLEIERADRNRLLEPFFGEPQTRVPLVRFEYTSRGVPEDELAAMLERRRASFQRARPTKMAFILDAVVIAKAEHTGWENLSVDGFGLRFSAGGAQESVDLEQPYEEFMEGRLMVGSPQEALKAFLASAAHDLAEARRATQFNSVRNLLLPHVVRSDEADRLERNGVVTRHIGHGVSVVVTCRVGDGSAVLESGDLSRWMVSFDEVLETARGNLDRCVRQGTVAFMPTEIVPGKKAVASFMTGFTATGQPAALLVAPAIVTPLREMLRAEDILCAIPDQASFFAIPAGDPELSAALRAFARERMLAADGPLAAELFRVSERGVEEA